MKLFKTALCLSLMGTAAFSEQYNSQNNQNDNRIGTDIPNTVRTNRYLYPELQRDRVEMDTARNSKTYKDVQIQSDYRKKVLSGVYDIDISMKPEYRLLQKTDLIKLSPKFITGILLPGELVITDAKASFPTTVASFTNNSMRVQPVDDFYSGNISIAFTDGKKNYYMTIVAERYFQNRSEVEDYISAVKKSNPSIAQRLEKQNKNVNDYAYTQEHISLIYQYMLPTVLSPEDAIVMYERMTQSKGIDIEDGDFVSFMYDGVTYRIERDDKQGTLIYGEKAYTVKNSLNGK